MEILTMLVFFIAPFGVILGIILMAAGFYWLCREKIFSKKLWLDLLQRIRKEDLHTFAAIWAEKLRSASRKKG